MADGQNSQDKNSWENWLGGWVQAAKEKSNTALEFVKKDLAEFTCTMQKETEKALEKTVETLSKEKTTQATNKVKAGFSSFLDNISKVLVIPPDDDYVQMKVASDGSGLYDRGKARLHAIQLDAATYMDPPRGPPEQFSMWLESFDMDQHKGEISELLVSKVEVRALYTKLVPGDVSHAEFWQRYFYRVHQLECDEARKQALMKRAEQTRGDSLSWDDDDDWSGGEEEDHQSDWEKLARPPQSYAATQKEANIKNESSHELANKLAEEQIGNYQNTESIGLSSTCQLQTLSDVEKIQPSGDDHTEIVVDQKNIPEKDSTYEHKLADEVLKHYDTSQDLSNTNQPDLLSADDLNFSDLKQTPLTDLWSLHIPQEGSKGNNADDSAEIVASVSDNHDQMHPVAFEKKTVNEIIDDKIDTEDIKNKTLNAAISDNKNCPIDSITAANDLSSNEILTDFVHPPQELGSNSNSSLSEKDVLSEVASPATDVLTPSTSAFLDSPTPRTKSESGESAEDTSESSLVLITAQSNPDSEKSSPEHIQANDPKEIGMSVKGDMVVVGERVSPLSDTSDIKELGQEDDWEQDFDIEITEEDLKAADSIAKKLSENINVDSDDWENWE